MLSFTSGYLDASPQPDSVRYQYSIGYVMELSWHHIFGEPWLFKRQNWTLLYPRAQPSATEQPSPSPTATSRLSAPGSAPAVPNTIV